MVVYGLLGWCFIGLLQGLLKVNHAKVPKAWNCGFFKKAC
jgi:hypothetical protein